MSLRQFALALALGAVCGPAQAQISRVFVSVNGNDANVCSNIATPCRTLGGGIGQVDPQGEVIVVDSGSFAGTTITKSVRINVAAGAVAFSGLPIVSNPGMGGTVVLRGLTLKSANPGVGTGITHQSGVLFVENTIVDGWYDGLVSASTAERLHVKGSVFRNQANEGLLVQAGSTARVVIDDSFFERNGFVGVRFQGGKGRVSNSVMSDNTAAGGVAENAGTEVTFQRCEVSHNIQSGLYAGLDSTLRVSQSTMTRNGVGLLNNGGMTTFVVSFGNNVIVGNTTDIGGTITPGTLQ